MAETGTGRNERRKSDTDSLLAGIRGVLFLLVLVASATAAYFTKTSALEEELRSIREMHLADQKSNATEHLRFEQSIDRISQRISEHTGSGVDGIPHPNGVIIMHNKWIISEFLPVIKRIEMRLDKLERE